MSPTVRALNGRRPFRGHTRHLTPGLSNSPGPEALARWDRRETRDVEGAPTGRPRGASQRVTWTVVSQPVSCAGTLPTRAVPLRGRRPRSLMDAGRQGDVAPEALCPPRRWPPLPPGSGLSFPDPDSTSPASPDHVVGLFSQKLIESKENPRIPPEHT